MGRKQTKKGTGMAFLQKHLAHQGEVCVPWPLFIDPASGYGLLYFRKRTQTAHRIMCQLAHGDPPTPKHHAGHSCHNRICINPNHLSWKTHSENMLDKRANGTANVNNWGQRGKLTAEQAAAILALKGKKTQVAIAKQFGITESNVRNIHKGKIWSRRIAALAM
jgi:hypothetical protein